MKLESSVFGNDGAIPSKYTCDGANVNPPLSISGIPNGAKSLVLLMDDPDAVKAAGKIWDHWVVFNIPPSTTNISEGQEPKGTQGITSFGQMGYGGPCPPDTEHRYHFKVFALNCALNLKEGSTKKQVEAAMKGHVLAQAELTGRYSRT